MVRNRPAPSSYVPQEKAKDTQLQVAIDLLHRKKSGCSQNEWIRLGVLFICQSR